MMTTILGPLAARLDHLLRGYYRLGFSGAVLLIDRGEIVLRGGYGAEPDAPFPAASITKQFVAAAILRLESEGVLKISDPIDRYIGPLASPYPSPRIEHLLTHTSGVIRAGTAFSSRSREEFLAKLGAIARESAPGERWRYSNTGYAVLWAVIERATGQAGETYIGDNVIRLSGMKRASFVECGSPPPVDLPRGYEIEDPRFWTALSRGGATREARRRRPAPPLSLDWATRAAGGMVATLDDIATWEQSLAAHTVLTPAATKEMFAPRVKLGPQRDQAYAWRKAPTSLGDVQFLDGDYRGYQAAWLRYRNGELILYLTTNVSGGEGWRPTIRKRFEEIVGP